MRSFETIVAALSKGANADVRAAASRLQHLQVVDLLLQDVILAHHI